MEHYFYLGALLPSLSFPGNPPITFEELKPYLDLNLSKKDKKKLETLRLFIDISNLRPLLQEQEIDPRGNLGEKELDEALLTGTILPQYVFDFLAEHETLHDRLFHFASLLSRFYQEEGVKHKGFLGRFFAFERELRLVLVALRAKNTGRDILKELVFEDPTEPFIAQILAQKDSSQYEPPSEYKEVKEILDRCGGDPLMQNEEISKYRFNRIGELAKATQFSIDWILAYIARLVIVEHWSELDQNKGKVILDTFKTS